MHRETETDIHTSGQLNILKWSQMTYEAFKVHLSQSHEWSENEEPFL